MSLSTPFTVELRDVPFTAQEQILKYIGTRLPRFMACAIDAGGNGAFLAERARQIFGAGRVDEVKLSTEWYREHMPKLRSGFNDGTVELPKHSDYLDDFRALKMERGVAKVPEKRSTGADNKKRHGDAAIALALAIYASHMNVLEFGYEAVGRAPRAVDDPVERRGPDDDGRRHRLFSDNRGAW